MRVRPRLAVAALLLPLAARAEPAFPWWNAALPHRVRVDVTTFGVPETDAPVHVRLNFTPMLGDGRLLDPGSVRVVECAPDTGAVLQETPCLFQPVHEPWPGAQPLSWQKPYNPETPPNIRASSENPERPARSLIERSGFWEAGSATPPWIVALDLGQIETVNAIFAQPRNDGRARHAPRHVAIEVATESADGLTQGNWERVGGWEGLGRDYIFGMVRPVFFAPRPVRYVRAVITATTGEQPWLGALDVYRPLYDRAERAEARVSWFAAGKTEAPRVFYIYFAATEKPGARPPPPARVALIQEAEEAVNTAHPSGVRFHGAYDATASGPTTPNMLSVKWREDRFIYPAGFAVEIPRADAYTIAFRVRGNPGDHNLRVLVDSTEIYAGVLSLEGEDWNVVSLAPLELPAGIRYLQFLMTQGAGPKPLDFDVVTIVNAAEFAMSQGLRATPARPEVRP